MTNDEIRIEAASPLDTILSAAARDNAIADAATKEWWPRHPMGGREIYADANSNAPIATFTHPEDCELALHARTDLPAWRKAAVELAKVLAGLGELSGDAAFARHAALVRVADMLKMEDAK